jgi:hypothetical protein
MPKPLSPAAQAVLDAFRAEWPDEALKQDCKCLAAALCALADQVEPDDGISAEVRQVLNKILAIATELEGHV